MSNERVVSLSHDSARDEAPFLSVIIPALNEEKTLDEVVGAVLKSPVNLEVILVDDGSSDRTWELMQSWVDGDKVRGFHHDFPQGKGSAVRTALHHARGKVVLIQDADMEYDIDDYPRLLEPILNGRARVVYGTRVFASHTAHSYWYVLGNKGVTTAANILYNVYLSDIETAYKVFPLEAALAMDLEARGFEIDPEITAKLLRMGYRIHEVPVEYVARSREEGKKIKPKDGVKALGVLLRNRLWHPTRTAETIAATTRTAHVVGHGTAEPQRAAERQ
jgi:glycosyltransferase involved in cell wall biosynthesis